MKYYLFIWVRTYTLWTSQLQTYPLKHRNLVLNKYLWERIKTYLIFSILGLWPQGPFESSGFISIMSLRSRAPFHCLPWGLRHHTMLLSHRGPDYSCLQPDFQAHICWGHLRHKVCSEALWWWQWGLLRSSSTTMVVQGWTN